MLQWGAVNADSASAEGLFNGVASEDADRRVTVERGQIGPLPVLDRSQTDRLATGQPVLIVSRAGGVPGVYLIVRSLTGGGGYPRRWGYFELAPAIAGLELARDGIDLCVQDAQGSLACNAAGDQTARDAAQLSARWPMFLKSEFGAPGWTVTATQRRADALAPLAEFRRSFLLGLVFAIVLVFVLQPRPDPPADDAARRSRKRAPAPQQRRFPPGSPGRRVR